MSTAALSQERRALDTRRAERRSEPLRVLMVLESDFQPHGGGGAESQVRTLARHLRRIGQQVTVLTPRLPRGPQATVERCAGLPVARVRYPHVPLLGGLVMCLRLAAFLWRKRARYDVWHVHIAHHMAAVACVIAELTDTPVILKVSGIWELEHGFLAPGGGAIAAVARRWLRRATAVQAISTRIARELARQGFPEERILVLPNAVDTTRFRTRSSFRPPGEPFTVVAVGRLVREKGLSTLLDAWAAAFGGCDGAARLRLVGGGPLEGELRAKTERLGISRQVELLGPKERVEDVLAAADVGVLPSRFEGLSNTLLEFMASGLPVVATRVSGSEDFVIPGRNGWLVEVDDASALAAALAEAAAAPAERLSELGRNARADVVAAATLDVVAERMLALYRGR